MAKLIGGPRDGECVQTLNHPRINVPAPPGAVDVDEEGRCNPYTAVWLRYVRNYEGDYVYESTLDPLPGHNVLTDNSEIWEALKNAPIDVRLAYNADGKPLDPQEI